MREVMLTLQGRKPGTIELVPEVDAVIVEVRVISCEPYAGC